MAPKLTTREFIIKARKNHGDKFDYSKVEYLGFSTPVSIACPIHGPFVVTPTNHLAGRGCRGCLNDNRKPFKRPPRTTEENQKVFDSVIRKFREVHGDKYDYRKFKLPLDLRNYWNTTITVICPVHGDFDLTPNNHVYKSQQCKYCKSEAREPRKTNDTFVSEAEEVHGARYDYSNVIYKKGTQKVEIICPDHGPFFQAPDGHLAGKGCTPCANLTRNDKLRGDTESFVIKARAIHGAKYTYESVVYRTSHEYVEITCPDHGKFDQTPTSHLNGRGCGACGILKRARSQSISQKNFVESLKEIFGESYDYENISYQSYHVPVAMRCKKSDHGYFKRRPADLMQGAGCQKCGFERSGEKQRLSQEEFVARAKIIHEDQYSYPDLNYRGLAKEVKIKCPSHGDFYQLGSNHLQGKGCGDCAAEVKALYGKTVAQHKFDGTDIPGRLYILQMFSDDEIFFKIGITSKTIKTRWKSLGGIYDYEVLADLPMGLLRAWQLEQGFLSTYKKHQYMPEIYFGGVTECFSINPIELDLALADEVSNSLRWDINFWE